MTPNSFPEDVVKEIAARGVVPKSRRHFLFERGAIWLLAAASVLVGGVAFAIAEFVFFDNDGIAKLHGSSIEDIAQSIPFVWLALVVFFAVIAYYTFRRTRHGYRYATLWVVSAVVALSIGLGILLNTADFGRMVYEVLTGQHITAPDGPD